MASKTLVFRGGRSLSRPTTLFLTFDKRPEGISNFFNPTVWSSHMKSTSFPAGGGGKLSFEYTPKLAFTRAQKDGTMVSAEVFVPIKSQQRTTLTKNNSIPPVYTFSNPEIWKEGQFGEICCVNETDAPENIGIGFYGKESADPVTALVLKDINGGGTSIVAQFSPVLSAYISTGYQSSDTISARIQGKLRWEQNLSTKIPLEWVLEETPEEGYKLLPSD